MRLRRRRVQRRRHFVVLRRNGEAHCRPSCLVRFLGCARNDIAMYFDRFSFYHFTRPFCHFYRSIVFSLSLAQNRGFCAKEERQRSEVASRIYAACLERSLARRAKWRDLGAKATGKRAAFRCIILREQSTPFSRYRYADSVISTDYYC